MNTWASDHSWTPLWIGLTGSAIVAVPLKALRRSAASVLIGLTRVTSRRPTAMNDGGCTRVKDLTPQVRPHWREGRRSTRLACRSADARFLRAGDEAAPIVAAVAERCHCAAARIPPDEGEQMPPAVRT